MVPRLRGQDLLFGGAETLDFAPPSNKISDYWGGSCLPCPPYNYLTGHTWNTFLGFKAHMLHAKKIIIPFSVSVFSLPELPFLLEKSINFPV